MFEVCGVKTSEFKTVCSSVDKLDKVAWQEIRKELINEKHISADVVDNLEGYVCARGRWLCSWAVYFIALFIIRLF